jgi:single-stranded DNA-binding protein
MTAYGMTAEYVDIYLKKGSEVGIIGTQRTIERNDNGKTKRCTKNIAITIENYSKKKEQRICGIDDGEQLTIPINPPLSELAKSHTEMIHKKGNR